MSDRNERFIKYKDTHSKKLGLIFDTTHYY